ncbi:MAG: hypothetical protein GC166_00600 [Alphaproteobacteria bacterium]|nr:hypothetical protein [Alphaproteobacteria bacterium]
MSDHALPARAEGSDLRLAAILAYALYLAALLNGITALVGVVVAYVKRADARGTIYESHFSNLIAVFWVSIILFALVCAGVLWGALNAAYAVPDGDPIRLIMVAPFALVGFAGILVWYLYRTVRGLIRAIDGEAYR